MAESGGVMPDPLALLKQMTESQEQVWSKALQEMMSTDAFAAAMGRQLESLTSVQATITRALDQHYRTLNLPSRTDVTRLATEVADLRGAVLRLVDRIDELAERWETPDRASSRSPGQRQPGTRSATPRKPAAARRSTAGPDAETAPAKKAAARSTRSADRAAPESAS